MTKEERENNINFSIDKSDADATVPDLQAYSAGQLQNFSPASTEDDLEARSLLRKAWEKINQGDCQKAGDIFEMALFEARRVFKSGGLALADFITDVGSGLFLCGAEHYELSSSLVRESITIRTTMTGEANLHCGRLYRQLASMLIAEGKYTEAAAAMRKTIDIVETMKLLGAQQDEKELARLYKDLAHALNLEDAAAQGDAPEKHRGGLHNCTEKANKSEQTDYADDVLKQREDS